MTQRPWGITGEQLRFVVVGVLNTAIGYGLFALIVQLPIPLFWAMLISTVLSILFNFRTIGSLVFQVDDPRLIVRFYLGYGFYFGIAYMVLSTAVSFGFPVLPASAVLVVPMAGLSYLINKHFVFRPSPKE